MVAGSDIQFSNLDCRIIAGNRIAASAFPIRISQGGRGGALDSADGLVFGSLDDS